MEMPKATIPTKDAAEAIFFLFQTFDHPASAPLESWIEELKEDWPDLSAMLFTVSRDE